MYNPIVLLTLLLLFVTNYNTFAQTDDFPFSMGLPAEIDEAFEDLPVKARLIAENYRGVGSKASLEKYAPTAKSQGKYGTCTAWAAGYCGRTILEAQRQGWTDQSVVDANTFSIGFLYRISSAHADCNGAFVSTCLEKLRDVGVPKSTEFTEDCPQGALPKDLYTKAKPYRIKGFASLWNTANPATPKESVRLVKKSISEGNPVVIAMIVPTSFCYSQTDTWTPDKNDTPEGNQGHAHGKHAMCIIAYDDDKNGGAFLLQNSWGSRWGDKGRIWISYRDAAKYIYQAVEMFKLPMLKQQEDKQSIQELAGSIKLIENTGETMTASLKGSAYKMNQAYRSGTRFRLYINNRQKAYVYAIGSDLSHKTFQIFPHKPGVSPMLNYSYNSVPIPSADQHIRLDGNVGTDYICVLYSATPLDIDQLRQSIRRQSNYYTFRQKVVKAVGSKLISTKNIQYQADKMSFKAKSSKGSVVALFMELEHIE